MEPMQSLRDAHAEPDSRGLLSVYVFNSDKKRWTRAAYATPNGSAAPSTLCVLTWNVDFMAPQAEVRYKCVLEHIQNVVFNRPDGDAPEPCAILLQEIEAEYIPVLLNNEWIRAHFQVTPISKWNWPNHAHYGSITLIARSVSVINASSLVFTNSHMSRNALIVDVELAPAPEVVGTDKCEATGPAEMIRVRIGNVHLESLQQGAKARPEQLALVADALKEPGVAGGLVCGDMNAIMECDKSIASSLGLSDAYLGEDDDPNGHTWGYQPVCGYSPGRLEKVLYIPGRGLVVDEPQRVGVGLKTAKGFWATDHYGLLTSVSISRES